MNRVQKICLILAILSTIVVASMEVYKVTSYTPPTGMTVRLGDTISTDADEATTLTARRYYTLIRFDTYTSSAVFRVAFYPSVDAYPTVYDLTIYASSFPKTIRIGDKVYTLTTVEREYIVLTEVS